MAIRCHINTGIGSALSGSFLVMFTAVASVTFALFTWPMQLLKWTGGPVAVIDCFGILDDEKICRYFEFDCEVKALGRGHIQRIKEEVRKKTGSK